MAQKVQIDLLSDLALAEDPESKIPADRTTRIALDGLAVDIDLSEGEYKALTRMLSPYLTAGRPVGRNGRTAGQGRARPARSGQPERKAAVDTIRVRNWAREEGLAVKDRGRIPAGLVEKYETVTGESAYKG